MHVAYKLIGDINVKTKNSNSNSIQMNNIFFSAHKYVICSLQHAMQCHAVYTNALNEHKREFKETLKKKELRLLKEENIKQKKKKEKYSHTTQNQWDTK